MLNTDAYSPRPIFYLHKRLFFRFWLLLQTDAKRTEQVKDDIVSIADGGWGYRVKIPRINNIQRAVPLPFACGQ